MKKLLLFFLSVLFYGVSDAQLKLPPSGANQKSVVKQYIGAHASVSIIYRSPDVTSPQGQSRRGQIWGKLVPYGLNNLGFGISTADNPSPWRAGANENTIIKFSHDVEVQGKPIAAGTYGFHVIPAETGPWTLIFSNNSTQWGSYWYEEKDDALRVETTPEATSYHEWLTFEFTDRQESECTVALMWDELSIPFTVSLPNSQELYVSHLREQMQNVNGFSWVNRNQAANYCLSNEINMEEALEWQKITAANSFLGNENATTLQTLAGLQMKLGQVEDGQATMKRAAMHATANVTQVHQMGRQLLGIGQKEFGLEIFKLNMEKNGNVWPVNWGLARGYSANGDLQNALKYAKVALENAPNQPNKDYINQQIAKLETGEGID